MWPLALCWDQAEATTVGSLSLLTLQEITENNLFKFLVVECSVIRSINLY